MRPLNSDEPAASCGLIFIPQTGSVTWSAVALCNLSSSYSFLTHGRRENVQCFHCTRELTASGIFYAS